MPPKNKFTRAEMTENAVEIVREKGISGLTARSLAEKMNCSVKPIFGLFKNMEEVQTQVLMTADRLFSLTMEEEMKKGLYPPYKAAGMGYVRFAQEEKELYKLLFMRDRRRENLQNDDFSTPVIAILQEKLRLTPEEALLFHTEMWIFVHGMASMVATDFLSWDTDFVSRALTDVFEGLKSRFKKEEAKEDTNDERH